MSERTVEETIGELEYLKCSPDICYACQDNPICERCILTDAIEHLRDYQKTNRTVKAKFLITNMGFLLRCGECNKPVHSEDVYCSHCGSKLDWSDE